MKPVLFTVLVASAAFLSACQNGESKAPAEEAKAPPVEAAPYVKPGQLLTNEELIQYGDEAREAASMLGAELKAELIAAIEADGPVGGVKVCSEKAPEIATRISEDTGYEVGRVSFKPRNPENTPDAWETESFERFETSVSNGFPLDQLERFQGVKNEAGEIEFRYMKPIIMGDVCATCHGANISDEVRAVIDEYYPDDQATGFEPGELRGAFTVSKVVKAS